MQYHPKLKKVMEEIKDLLKKNDIAAVVVLHTPGFSEYLLHCGTTYSCCTVNEEGIRVRAKLIEDFKGDKAMWEYKVKSTANMLHHLAVVHGQKTLTLLELSDHLDQQIGAEYDQGDESSHTTQNN
jgi:hypothetical protein